MAADDASGAVDEQEEWLSRITDAPTYRPTAEEFEDPIKYIASIREVSRQHGDPTWFPRSARMLFRCGNPIAL